MFFLKKLVTNHIFAYICGTKSGNVPLLPPDKRTFFNNPLTSKFMNKTELTKAVAAKAGLTQVDAKKAIDATIESITEALKAGDKVALIGFGTFAVAQREARQGINPQTKAVIKIAAKKQAKFKAGAELDAAIQ
ncbi:MAG: HU family DNA-binding protein [Bacteroidaceae bacterium]|nr:HU family DNA-binding protein [Bacteroidaceae bacterium]